MTAQGEETGICAKPLPVFLAPSLLVCVSEQAPMPHMAAAQGRAAVGSAARHETRARLAACRAPKAQAASADRGLRVGGWGVRVEIRSPASGFWPLAQATAPRSHQTISLTRAHRQATIVSLP